MQYLSNVDIFPHNAPLFSLSRIQMKKYQISRHSRKNVHGQRKSACVVQEEHSASPQAKTQIWTTWNVAGTQISLNIQGNGTLLLLHDVVKASQSLRKATSVHKHPNAPFHNLS